ncbi:MAG: DUF6134 family protein [Steroidobacteraceae bacterium]
MRIHSLWLSGMLLVGILLAGSAGAMPSQANDWNFKVLLDGKPIGSHRFQVTEQGMSTSLLSEADFRVTVMAVPLYRYRHVSHETFQGDCLQSLEASTNENGTTQDVRGSVSDAAFVVTTSQGVTRLPSCVMTFDYWNPRILQQSRLLNPQTGAYLPIVVTRLGSEILAVDGKSEMVETYLITADTMKIKLWYSADQRWLGLETATPNGRLMRYQLR